MAQYCTVHADPLAATKGYSYSYGNPASWTSEEDDTESESEQSFRSFECRRKKPCAIRRKVSLAQLAAPVMIPARTHDFGWCDRDDTRAQPAPCACGNDCDEFFHNDAQPASWAAPTTTQNAREDGADDEFIFDMEM